MQEAESRGMEAPQQDATDAVVRIGEAAWRGVVAVLLSPYLSGSMFAALWGACAVLCSASQLRPDAPTVVRGPIGFPAMSSSLGRVVR